MSTESVEVKGKFYLLEVDPVQKRLVIKEYIEENVFRHLHTANDLSESYRRKIKKRKIRSSRIRFKRYLKSELKKLYNEHVFLIPSKTKDEFWSYENLMKEKRPDGYMFTKFDVYEMAEGEKGEYYALSDKPKGEMDVESIEHFNRKDFKRIVKFFKENILE